MAVILLWIARLAAAAGVALTIMAVLGRLAGAYQLGDFQALTLLQAGTAAMVLGCLAYVASMAEGPSGRRQ